MPGLLLFLKAEALSDNSFRLNLPVTNLTSLFLKEFFWFITKYYCLSEQTSTLEIRFTTSLLKEDLHTYLS